MLKATGRLADLIGKEVLYFETAVYQQALLTLSVLERRYSYFGEKCYIQGEDVTSSDEFPRLQVVTSDGIKTVNLTLAYDDVTIMAMQLEVNTEVDGVLLCGASVRFMQLYEGKNLDNKPMESWRSLADGKKTKDGVEDLFKTHKMIRALHAMQDAERRDPFEEERDRVENGGLTTESGLTAEDREAIGGVDKRNKLSAFALNEGYVRCASFTCIGVLQPEERACVKCCCRRKCEVSDLCVCEHCGTRYDVNRQSICGMCEKCLPHSSRYVDQKISATLQEAVVGKTKSALTVTKLKDMLQNGVVQRVLRDASLRESGSDHCYGAIRGGVEGDHGGGV